MLFGKLAFIRDLVKLAVFKRRLKCYILIENRRSILLAVEQDWQPQAGLLYVYRP